MTGDILEITLFMWIAAIFSFAPFGYFVYIYMYKDGKPFGDTEPHGDSESKVLDLAEALINKIKGKA